MIKLYRSKLQSVKMDCARTFTRRKLGAYCVAFAAAQGSSLRAQWTETQTTGLSRDLINRTRGAICQVFTRGSSGTGFLVELNGQWVCLTNLHVVRSALVPNGPRDNRQVDVITVQTSAGNRRVAFVWKSHRAYDVAVLIIGEREPGVTPLPIIESLPPENSSVFLWGAPYGEALVPLDGVVNAIRYNTKFDSSQSESLDVVEARISVAPGNSGGPLLNMRGEVVGVVTRREITRDETGTGIALAVAARSFWPSLRQFSPPSTLPAGTPR